VQELQQMLSDQKNVT
jgi:serine/threonine-protein phosphatase 2A regulatory subunit B'